MEEKKSKGYWRRRRRAWKRARRLQSKQQAKAEKAKQKALDQEHAVINRARAEEKKARKKERKKNEKQAKRDCWRAQGGLRGFLRLKYIHARRWLIRTSRRLWRGVKAIPRADYRHWLSLVIVALSLAATFTVCVLSIERLGDAFIDLKSSAIYYWQKVMLRIEEPPTDGLTINVLPEVDLQKVCPFSIADLERKLQIWGKSLLRKDLFLSYLADTLNFIADLALILPSAIILVFALPMALKSLLFRHTTSRKDTKALVFWKKRVTPILAAVKGWLRGFIDFLKQKGYRTVLVIVWMFNLNAITVIVEFLAWYLHFATGIDLSATFISIVRLFIDLLIMLWSAPWPFWVVFGWWVFDTIRRDIGYDVLRHHEAKNGIFFSILAVVVLIVGTMGKGKTTMLTSIALTGQNYFRKKARALMYSIDMKFPKFPMQRFEDAIDAAYAAGELRKLRHVKELVRRRRRQFEIHRNAHSLYGYDIKHANMSFDDQLKVVELFEALETYAKLYYLYTIRLPLLIGNYSIRSDAYLKDEGNFPIWKDDFFQKTPKESEDTQEYSHILDMDTMRLNKFMDPENKFRGSKDVGIVTITELGKERGNMLEHKGMKKDAEVANPLNDGFNSRVKMDRHAALIENVSFTKIIGDEQREESLGADARELADVIKIRDKGAPKLAMPGYALGNLFHTIFGDKFESLYYEYRYERGDQTLFGYAMKNLWCLFYHHHLRIWNTFGYHVLTVEICDGKQEEQGELLDYYIAYKKDYSNRFKSDGFVDAFEEQAKLTEYGLEDYPQFGDIQSTVREMKMMNSYFANQLIEQMMNGALERLVEEQDEDSSENSTKGS